MPANKRTGLVNILISVRRKVGWLVYPTHAITDISARRHVIFSAMMSLTLFLVVLTGFVANIFVYGLDHFVTLILASLSIILFLAYVFSRSRAFRYVGPALLTFSLSASAFVVALSHPDRETLYISGAIFTFLPLALVMGSALLPSWGNFALMATNFIAVLLLPVMIPTYPLDRAGADAGAILSIGVLLLGTNAYRNDTERLRLAEIQETNQQLQEANRALEAQNIKLEKARIAVQDSEQRFRTFVEQSTDGLLLTDEQGIIIEQNMASEKLTGIKRDEIIGRPIWDMLVLMMVPQAQPSGTRQKFQEIIRKTLRTDPGGFEGESREVEIVRPDNSRAFVLHNIFLIKTETGYRFGSITHDITESKRAERALSESERKFRNFIEQSTEGFVLVDENGKVIEWNQAQELLSGISRKTALGMHLWDVQFQMTVPEHRNCKTLERTKAMMLKMLNSGRIPTSLQHVDVEICRPDDQRILIQQSMFPIKTERGYQLGTVVRDITRRKQAEQEREILQHFALELTAPLKRIELVKLLAKYCRQLFSYDSFRFDLYEEQEQLRIPVYAEDTPADGQTPVDVETDSEARKPGITRGVFDGKPVLVNRKPGKITDGLIPWGFASRQPQSMLFVPVRWHGHCIGVVYVQSYTPERYNDRDLMLLQMVADQCGAALARVQADVERENLIRELTAKNSELERFTYTVSHDLKAPLITITGFLGYLEEDATAGNIERVRHDSLRIKEAVSKMKLLLDELLELSRIGRLINPPETIAFEELVNEALTATRGRLEARGVNVNIQPDLPNVRGDRRRLVEVLQNLIDNAAKFMGDQPVPQIEFGCQEKDGNPVFFVKDNGIGIEPRFHEQIFGLFNKLNPSIEGTGVGLALVRRIIEVHGGRIWVESEAGQGSAFYFTIPTPTIKRQTNEK